MAEAHPTRHERLTKTVVEAIEPPATGHIVVWDAPAWASGAALGFASIAAARGPTSPRGACRAAGRSSRRSAGMARPGRQSRRAPRRSHCSARSRRAPILREAKRAARKAERERRDGAEDRERQQRLVRSVGERWVNRDAPRRQALGRRGGADPGAPRLSRAWRSRDRDHQPRRRACAVRRPGGRRPCPDGASRDPQPQDADELRGRAQPARVQSAAAHQGRRQAEAAKARPDQVPPGARAGPGRAGGDLESRRSTRGSRTAPSSRS